MTKKKQNNIVDDIATDIRKVAANLGVDPTQLTLTKYRAESSKFTEWQIRQVGGFVSIRNTYFGAPEIKDEASIVDSKDLRSKFNKLKKEIGERELFIRRLEETWKDLPKLQVKPYKPSKAKKSGSRTLNLMLSDLHFGSDLTMEEHMVNYGPIEEARLLAKVVKNVCSYKQQYRDQTELVVNVAGDIIENELHGPSTTDYLHIQACRAIWLLSQAISRFSESFPTVIVNFAVGNHGRDTAIHPKRATDMKFNALETTIYFAVKMACAGFKNIKWNQPLTPWISYNAQGHKTYVTHGDTHLNPGNPGSKLDVKSLENQTNKINASLNDKDEYEVFVVGHVHHAMATALSNGAMFLSNGALPPPNGFAQSLNIMESQQIQIMWESTQEYAVGDMRFIIVTGAETDSSLDDIIKPFPGLNAM